MLDIKTLYTLLINEASMDTLQPLDKEIYLKIADTLAHMKGQGYEGLEGKIRDTLVQLISDMASTLLKIRLTKYETNKSNLTYEELYIINTNDEYKIKEEFVIQSMLEGRRKVLEGIVERIKTKRIMIRILKDVDEFIGVDNTRYGKYNAENIAVLPLEDARRLINNGYAKEIIIQE